MPPILTPQRLEKNIRRLITAPDDLIECGARLAGSQISQTGVEKHQILFEKYLAQLKPLAHKLAVEWMEAMELQTSALGSAEEARRFLIQEQPAGPANDMRFTAVVIQYWLECDAINAELKKVDWVDPPRFLLSWVVERKESICADVLASQPYWPIGLTKEGHWI